MPTGFAVLKNRYFDSVFLMRAAKRLGEEKGVEQAAVVMGSERNVQTLAQAGYAGAEEEGATPNDLLVALQGSSVEGLRAVLDHIEDWLVRDESAIGITAMRTMEQALSTQPKSNLAVISVPGEYAAREARRALEHGLNVFLFSDNVPVEEEISLKQLAEERGLLVMGPDCGTGIIAGSGIGFANSVRQGPVGVVGPSGTGIQEITTLVHRAGSGISHAIGGLSTLRGIDALEADPGTTAIVVVSKPPDGSTYDRVRDRISRCSKPVVTCFLGKPDEAPYASPHVAITHDLDEAAILAVRLTNGGKPAKALSSAGKIHRRAKKERPLIGPQQKYIRGVFAGGTFCYQAQQVLQQWGLTVHSNEPLDPSLKLDDPMRSTGHSIVDMGADMFTRGRPHPMIDSTLRAERIRAEAEDPEVAILLLDFILGYGAGPDPAGALVEALHDAKRASRKQGGNLCVVTSLCGTPEDPQGLEGQATTLETAGALVFYSSFQAARFCAELAVGLAQRGA